MQHLTDSDLTNLLEIVTEQDSDGLTLLEKTGFDKETAPAAFHKAVTDLKSLTREQALQYAVSAADFAKHRFLSQIKPDGYLDQYVTRLDQAVKDDSQGYVVRLTAANQVMSAAVQVQQSRADGASCILEQVKFFQSWHTQNVDSGKEQDV